MKTNIYIRVSTEKQGHDSQLIGITDYCKKRGIEDFSINRDTASGSVPWRERKIEACLYNSEKGDLIIVSELSRIGRSTADVLNFLEIAASKGVSIVAVKNNVTFDGGIQAKIFATVLGLAAEIERDFIRLRTKEGMANAKAKGIKLGRPPGQRKTHQLDTAAEKIDNMLLAKIPKAGIARILNVSRGTLQRYLDRKEK